MNRPEVYVSVLIFLFLLPGTGSSQKMTREQYIERYSGWAIDEMNRSGIPASITMAQGLLESNNGNSTLAVQGNNHFGIKCHDWKGKKIHHDDDKKHECFRKYKSAKESFDDHTNFLMNTPRYSFLFALEQTDYKGWARGLKKAGYATSPSYADLLIKIIEENDLHKLDEGKKRLAADTDRPAGVKDPDYKDKDDLDKNDSDVDEFEVEIPHRKILVRNRINYIIVKEGDTYQSLTRELDLMPFELANYNEIARDARLNMGQVVYLQPKRNQASVEFQTHTVEEGESMYHISQMYGIKLKKLYQKNRMNPGTQPETGQVLSLRKKMK